MKDNGDKQMDGLARKVIKKVSLESPSSNFTAQILAKVIASKQSDITIFRPLISKTTWFLIFGCLVALGGYAIIGVQPQGHEKFDYLDFNIFLNNRVSGIFYRLTFSKILVYALFSLSTMVIIQVFVFKRYFDKRFGVF